MLTRKQRWRRVRGGRFVEPCSSPSPSASDSPHPAGRQRRPHPINSLSIGDSLLHLLGSSTAGEEASEAARESESAAAAAAAETTPSAKKAPSGRVHFNHQVRVVLVPCRTELGGLKADIWWGEDDYVDFRREYILAVRAKMAGMGDEEDAPSCCAEDTTDTTAAAAEAEAPYSEAEAKAEVPEAGDPKARGPEATPPGEEHDDDNDVCAPLRRKRCHEGESAPPTSDVGPSRAISQPVEIPRSLLSSTPPPPATEAPKTPIFSCAFSTPDGAGVASGMTARPNESERSSAEGVCEEGRSEGVGVGGGGNGTTTVVVTAISRDALAAAAAVVGAAQTVAVSSSGGSGDVIACLSSSAGRRGSDAGNKGHMRPAGTVAAAAVVEGEDVVRAVEASLRRGGVVEKEDKAEELAPTQPPSRRSSCSSSSSSCSCSGCCASCCCASCCCSYSFSMARAAENFLEGAAEISTEPRSKRCSADGIAKDAARDEDEEEEEGYRTQSTSSVSDHTDAETDSDTDEGEDRSTREDSAVRKNGERPPRTPFRRELPVLNY